jgi:iron uptake system component EfeO
MKHEVRTIAATFAALLTVGGLAACGSDDAKTTSTAASGSGTKTPVSNTTGKVLLTLNDDGCSPKDVKIPAGSTTFEGKGNSGKVTEFEVLTKKGLILGERENVAPGLTSSFTLDLEPGQYDFSCSIGDHKPTGTLTVTGTPTTTVAATPSALVAAAVAGYKAYVASQVQELQTSAKSFVAALDAGDTKKAKDLFAKTRVYYERVEPVAESFGDLDPRIDARVNDVAKGDAWTGFHKIEQILWKKDTTDGTKKYGALLLKDIDELEAKSKELTYQAPQVANGAVGLLNEVANSKISGEEDRYSHTDLSDFKANVEGAQKAFELLTPVLEERGEHALVKTLIARFQAVSDALAPYERPGEPSGWALYDELTKADQKKLAQAVDALAEPLSTVAEKVSGSGGGN